MKRGLSSIVATVLIVLLVILLVGVIWVTLFPMLNEGSEFDFSGDVQIISSEGYTVYDSDLKYAGVQVGVSADAVDLDRIRLTFLFDGESRSNVFPAPEAGQTKTYLINLSGEEYEQPASVSISPIDIFGKEGEITSTAELKTGDLADASGELLSLTGDFVEGDVSSGDSGGDLGEETVPKEEVCIEAGLDCRFENESVCLAAGCEPRWVGMGDDYNCFVNWTEQGFPAGPAGGFCTDIGSDENRCRNAAWCEYFDFDFDGILEEVCRRCTWGGSSCYIVGEDWSGSCPDF